MNIFIFNKGCIREEALNHNLVKMLKETGHNITRDYKNADYLIYVTCAGTGAQIERCYDYYFALSKLKKKEAKLIIAGCLSETMKYYENLDNRDDIIFINKYDYVIPIINYINNTKKRNTKQIMLNNCTRNMENTNAAIQFMLQDGCTNNCSFCKVHYFRKPLLSMPYNESLEHLKNCVKNGTRDITLSGENLCLYGIDLCNKQLLHKFIHDLSLIENLKYIHVNEITVQNMYPELLNELINNDKVISISLQLETASDKVLKSMNRCHTLEQYDYILRKLQEKGKLINTVLMSGYPEETYEDLDITIKYINDRKIYTGLICKYEDIECIPSHDLNQLTKREQIKHTMYLRDAIKQSNYNTLKYYLENDMTKDPVVIGYDDTHILLRGTGAGYSLRKDLYELPMGEVIKEKPKRIVKIPYSKIGQCYKY